MRILYALGARPNFVKLAPVIAELRVRLPDARHVLVDTGQHYDRMMSGVFAEELEMPKPDYVLGVGSGTHAMQTARVMERIEPIVADEKPDLVIVPGDVNSTLAVALVAAKMGVPLAHVEAGLRSFDRTMPEEINRIVADEFSDYLFIHSDEAADNLRAEGISEERVYFVGNTMIDTLIRMEPRFRELRTAERIGLAPGEYLLVTLHRPALVDGPLLQDVLVQLSALARELPVVFPVHPRTRQRIADMDVDPRLRTTDPLGYSEFLSLEADAAGVLTDSGGVQEETTYLGVPCFTLRDTTERPVTLRFGTNTMLGLNAARIGDILPMLAEDNRRALQPPPGWDGKSSERIADVICANAGTRSTAQGQWLRAGQ